MSAARPLVESSGGRFHRWIKRHTPNGERGRMQCVEINGVSTAALVYDCTAPVPLETARNLRGAYMGRGLDSHCYVCDRFLATEYFYRDAQKFNGLSSKCIECLSVYDTLRSSGMSNELAYARMKEYCSPQGASSILGQHRYAVRNERRLGGEAERELPEYGGTEKWTGFHARVAAILDRNRRRERIRADGHED